MSQINNQNSTSLFGQTTECNVPMVHDRFVSRRDNPLVGKNVCARAFFFACVRVRVNKVIDVCHDASPRMVMCT